jgi:hypothetical protein
MEHIHLVPEVPRPDVPAEKWNADSKEKIDEYLYLLKGLYLINNSTDSFKIKSGKYYIAEYNPLYWHFLHEDLAGYEGLKKKYPDLKLVLVDSQHVMKDSKTLNDRWKHLPYIEYFCSLYDVKDYYSPSENYWFEEVYYTPNSGMVLADADFWGEDRPLCIWPNDRYAEWDSLVWTERSPYCVSGMNIITKKLYDLIPVDYSLPKKIFISRRDVNARLKGYIGKPEYDHLVEERLYESDFLEKYFQDKGYEVIALEEHSYEKQMQFFMMASHVAGTVGAGFSNLHMSQIGTKLIELHVLPIYGFDYGYFKDYRGVDYVPVDLRNLSERRTFTEKEMIEALDVIAI